MNNSLSIEYALHSVVNLALFPPELPVTVRQLAGFMGLAPSYLSKVFNQLAKAGIVKTSVGSKGGIRLLKSPDEISFYDIFIALNGRSHMFQCSNIRAFAMGYEPAPGMCEVHQAMWEAEEQMFESMKRTKISTITKSVYDKLQPGELEERTAKLRQFMAGV
ncbi:transcriptional regulator, BadM/Rrf2 family [Paenibacillus sp. UNCCL117]|uniref:RrF2 family transcriptional regulator n=1 Tax=unclassified Paenibacillus TaxID=185978 RepID=UPI00088DD4D8|nr:MULTISPECIES: Rrf2 family transcriptional regulator [unclassified Paenibacillus]SDD13017.1 Rrf2 family protein [Paenibacillus sp. cl123]SFW33902.1 transcriptional regulator, BadM/Rrf2 family [Paenibacillus sp. UNCCL117]